ncbi:hypothetical protein [Chromohalobacter israelensis]|uniref:hypothetical protein n=1 Tax=Chromohalobacter israelensis TaxID=141390 RepID=UPI00265C3F86|nr:hypothetical protein [Chromohalobacter salexigens]MDO0945193.1 hypothetical protein [Chromohalobacter salexigens]
MPMDVIGPSAAMLALYGNAPERLVGTGEVEWTDKRIMPQESAILAAKAKLDMRTGTGGGQCGSIGLAQRDFADALGQRSTLENHCGLMLAMHVVASFCC